MRTLFFCLLSLVPTSIFAAPNPITSLAYHPDGSLLIAGRYQEVLILDTKQGTVKFNKGDFVGTVTGLAFRPDGKQLAVACGETGKSGKVYLFDYSAKVHLTSKSIEINAHKDLIYAICFHPNGSMLATAGYDRIIRLWNPVDGKLIRELQDHSDTIYGLSFHPEGKWLASAAADRAVKVWDVSTGKRLYTLGDPTDWVYAVAWSPDKKHLASAGVDKSIRVWEANAETGKLVHSVFAHNQPITKLIYDATGKTLFSMSEGKNVKSWDTSTMKEKLVFPEQSQTMLSLAVAPKDQQLAIGRHDGVLQLLDPKTGKLLFQPLPVPPKPATISKWSPNFSTRGQTRLIRFEGQNLDTVESIQPNHADVQVQITSKTKSPNHLEAEITIPKTIPIGSVDLVLKSSSVSSAPVTFFVDRYPAITTSPGDSARTTLTVSLPATLVGTLSKAGDADYFRFQAQQGQEFGFQVLTSSIGSRLEAVLELTDADGHLLVESINGLLGYVCPKAGMYAIGIRDREYRGGKDFYYRIHAGDVPVITSVFPFGIERGKKATVNVQGVHLGTQKSIEVSVPADAMIGSRLPVPVANTIHGEKPLGNASILVGEFPEIPLQDAKSIPDVPVPATVNGVIAQSGQTNLVRFAAKKGQPLILEVHARRMGSALDSFIEVLDSQQKPVPRATLRCVARTFVTFRDHDSDTAGIRLETWNELNMNDYLYVNGELIRIKQLPLNPDADCNFVVVDGKRVTYLDTSSTHHAMNSPMYKVEIHPPGSSFPPNGMPLFPLFYRNDDGGPRYGKDSKLTFDPPADGEYLVRIGDSRQRAGMDHGYRLTIRSPKPDFEITFDPKTPSVWKGGAIPLNIKATRLDGFEGPMDIRFENVPAGFEVPATIIEAEQTTTTVAMFAKSDTKLDSKLPPLKIVAKAKIQNQEVIREATGTLPKLIENGDITTTTQVSEVTIKPGQETRLTVKVDRHNKFNGRIPLDVRGLPHGVRVLDIGLNGILVLPDQTTREIVLYAEPWVEPQNHPFVVLARREGKNTEHAAKSVLLKVEK